MSKTLFVTYRDSTFAKFTVEDGFPLRELSSDAEGIAWEFKDGSGALYLCLDDIRSAYLCEQQVSE